MPQVSDTRKVFNWRIDIGGIDQFEVQDLELPEIEIAEVLHGDTNYDVKTPGKVKVGEMVLNKVRPAPQSDTRFWDWLSRAQNMYGGSTLAAGYQETLVVRELGPDGIITLNSYVCEGCWVKKVKQSKFDRMSSDNVIETAALSVNRIYKL